MAEGGHAGAAMSAVAQCTAGPGAERGAGVGESPRADTGSSAHGSAGWEPAVGGAVLAAHSSVGWEPAVGSAAPPTHGPADRKSSVGGASPPGHGTAGGELVTGSAAPPAHSSAGRKPAVGSTAPPTPSSADRKPPAGGANPPVHGCRKDCGGPDPSVQTTGTTALRAATTPPPTLPNTPVTRATTLTNHPGTRRRRQLIDSMSPPCVTAGRRGAPFANLWTTRADPGPVWTTRPPVGAGLVARGRIFCAVRVSGLTSRARARPPVFERHRPGGRTVSGGPWGSSQPPGPDAATGTRASGHPVASDKTEQRVR